MIGFLDLELDLDRCRRHFTEELKQPMSGEQFEGIVMDVRVELASSTRNASLTQ